MLGQVNLNSLMILPGKMVLKLEAQYQLINS